jgi:hypothetical protein
MFYRPCTNRKLSDEYVCPNPRFPYILLPAAYISPSFVNINECSTPADTFNAFLYNPLTNLKVSTFSVCETPSYLNWLSPHTYTYPSISTAIECLLPHDTFMKLVF